MCECVCVYMRYNLKSHRPRHVCGIRTFPFEYAQGSLFLSLSLTHTHTRTFIFIHPPILTHSHFLHQELSHHTHLQQDILPTRLSSQGDAIVSVLPYGVKENILAAGLVGELYCENVEKGEGEGEGEKKRARASRGREMERDGKEAGVVCVLGAGNFSAPIEVITKVRLPLSRSFSHLSLSLSLTHSLFFNCFYYFLSVF